MKGKETLRTLIKIKNNIDNDPNEQKRIMDLADRYQNRYGDVTDKDLEVVMTI